MIRPPATLGLDGGGQPGRFGAIEREAGSVQESALAARGLMGDGDA
jgi:hypothetical protein